MACRRRRRWPARMRSAAGRRHRSPHGARHRGCGSGRGRGSSGRAASVRRRRARMAGPRPAPRRRPSPTYGAQLTRTRRRHGPPAGARGHGEIATWMPASSSAACSGSAYVLSGRGSVVGGSGTLTIAPIIALGCRCGLARARRPGDRARPAASRWPRSRSSGQPPGRRPSPNSIAAGHAEPGRRVERAGPVVLEAEAAAIGPWRGRAVADDERPDALLAVAPHVEEGAALRRAHPLVAVPGRVRRTDGLEVDLDHARRMRGVDERLDPAVRERRDDLGHRQHERRRAGDVVEHDEPRPRADGRQHGVARHLGRRARERDAAPSPAARRRRPPRPGGRCVRRGRRGRAARPRRRAPGGGCARRC